MKIQLTPSWILTDERAECCFGIPVLINRADDSTAYGPADVVGFPPGGGGMQPAAHFVARFGKQLQGDDRQAADLFLRQWPQGPQID